MVKESVIAQLKEHGLKVTPQRLAIIDVLVALRDIHPNAAAVYREAKKIRKSLSLSTTYATLNEFSAHGIIKTLQFDPKENRYETTLDEHVNLICEGCGKILDYKVSSPANRADVEKNTGFSVKDTRLEYYGYCKKCLKKRQN
ncbi:MAG TPA: Fur family transcriptional regulator [Syntrophorhabdaceae bacterium]|nr:Fur family transcriptional regulator [Syntrophorhabdaceae bacterium]